MRTLTYALQQGVTQVGMALLLCSSFGIALSPSDAQAKSQRRNTHKLKTMPDFTQVQEGVGLPRDGRNYCGPAAASNVLMWLSHNGYPALGRNQLKMVRELGGPTYFKTSPEKGTGTSQILRGLNTYLLDHGYQAKALYYHGWRWAPKAYRRGVERLKLSELYQGLRGKGLILLNIGWYTQQGDDYLRSGGHWVTLAGHVGHDLIVFDPAPRNGQLKRAHRVKLKVLRKGQLLGNYKGLPRSAQGHYAIHSGLKLNSRADEGILDGAIFIQM